MSNYATAEKYFSILHNIEEARKEGNKRKLKTWRTKLEKWQLAYGAYQPIGGVRS